MKRRLLGIAALLVLAAGFGIFWGLSGHTDRATAESTEKRLSTSVRTAAETLSTRTAPEPSPETGTESTTEAPTEPMTEVPTEAPTETATEPPEPIEPAEPDPGLAGLKIKLSGELYATPDHPKVKLRVRFSGDGFEATNEPCVLECRRDGVLLKRVENFLPGPDAKKTFTVRFHFSRYMKVSPVTMTVRLIRGDEILSEETVIDVRNDPDEVWARKSGDSHPYWIDVVRSQNTVIVYGKDSSGSYTVPVKAFVCSTGTATPRGTYSIGYKYPWGALFGGVYGQYVSHITGHILFHSVPYYSMNKGNLETAEYNKLGTTCSMGCVRLPVRDAKWIFDNCPAGTTVHIYDSDTLPVAKPQSIHIDPSDWRAGWDPTDPDPNNPW